MDTYIRMKRAELKTEDEEAGDLVNFNAAKADPETVNHPHESGGHEKAGTGAIPSTMRAIPDRTIPRGATARKVADASAGPPIHEGMGEEAFAHEGEDSMEDTVEERGPQQGSARRTQIPVPRRRIARHEVPAKPSRNTYSPSPSSSSELNDEGEPVIKDRRGNLVKCRLCEKNHFMDDQAFERCTTDDQQQNTQQQLHPTQTSFTEITHTRA
eukprot:CAMPEP_0181298598 /NCGR_PEP_ID=MMETSP1101-20121128/5871_1 /TAXON_ID=46948 /ORGANISM="Rhodomonas abbreviata, Strain Caron Lab Isolate" /LENGTH=212 /DNA_ID=CAMNT_0023403637 /DNA_START=838 /DNA_END=1478 /DNA_ORIENTATION=+